MITTLLRYTRAALFALAAVCAVAQIKADTTPAPKAPTLEQRVGDLESYVNNSARVTASATAPTSSNVSGPGPGHNAWMMTSSALVLFMTLPGLALFYGGLVRRKNVLSVLAQCMGITGLVTILWWAVGFSLTFGTNSSAGLNAYIGGVSNAFFKGVDSNPGAAPWVSQNVFAIFQLTFAIITPALIIGSIAERMKFTAILAFITLWMFAVYFPLAHMVWGGGLLCGLGGGAIKAIDFAGGTVVHMSSGWSALILCLILGKRIGFGKESFAPHSMVLCMVGTGMLWVGWYGFNAGSELGADGIAANAFTTTTLATAIGSFVWGALEFIFKKHASVLGFCSGAVAGLVVITPACGFVNSTGAVIIGVLAAVVPFFFVMKVKPFFGYDDALDTFGVHAVGGTMGAILTGILADPNVNSNIQPIMKGLVTAQLKAVLITVLLSVVMTTIIAYIVKFTIGLRPTPEAERQGLDITDHNEEGYIL